MNILGVELELDLFDADVIEVYEPKVPLSHTQTLHQSRCSGSFQHCRGRLLPAPP